MKAGNSEHDRAGESRRGREEQVEAMQRMSAPDARSLLRLMGELAPLRSDPRRWRQEVLEELVKLPGAAAAAMTATVDAQGRASVGGLFDAGFAEGSRRELFLNEFNESPFEDPLSRQLLRRLTAGTTATAARRDLVDDATWYSAPSVQKYRREAGMDDCILSLWRRQGEGGMVMALWVFRKWDDPAVFSARDRLVVDVLHAGLEWVYRAEEASERVTRATALSPRLLQTLDYLLAGDTERQVAGKMSISIHTVHDYVKALYVHFGVSSRGELLARWVQSGGSPGMSPEEGG